MLTHNQLTNARQRYAVAVQLAATMPRIKRREEKRQVGMQILNIAKRLHRASTHGG